MTTFDKAFIKAFTDAPPHPAAASQQAAPPPHAGQDKPPRRARLGGSSMRVSEMGVPQAAPRKPSPPPRPLSSFSAQPRIQESWRALLEVDRFQWPATCDQLLSEARGEWDRFGEQLIERMSQGQKCVALASAGRGHGRTIVALTLAKLLASRGLRPVVIDADTCNPELAKGCGVSVHSGWDDLLTSELVLGESLISAVDDGVVLMPWRTALHAGSALPTSMRASTVFATLREHYDLAIVDALPLDGNITIAEFASFATAIHLDALYLVHNRAAGSLESLADTSAKLLRAGVPVMGVIENFVPAARSQRTAARDFPVAGPRPLGLHS
jgi:Mrp family chromosome partitioning ATPase